MYTVNTPVRRPVWREHKIIGYVTISRFDADLLNSIRPSDYYLGFSEEERRLLNSGTVEELKAAGFIN